MANIYCYGEPGTFPDGEFRRDSSGKLKVPHIHETGTPHYTTGQTVDPFQTPGLLIAELHGLALSLSEKNLKKLLLYVRNDLQ